MNQYKKIIALSLFIVLPANAGIMDYIGSAFSALWQRPKTSVALCTLSGLSIYNFYMIYRHKTDAAKKKTELESKIVTRLSTSDADKKQKRQELKTLEEALSASECAYDESLQSKAIKQKSLAKCTIPATHAQDTQQLRDIQQRIATLDSAIATARADIATLESELAKIQMPTQEEQEFLKIVAPVTSLPRHQSNYPAIKKKIDELLALTTINPETKKDTVDTCTQEYLHSKAKNQESVGKNLQNTLVYYISCLESLITRCTKTYTQLDAQYAGNFAYIDCSQTLAYELLGFEPTLAQKLTFPTVMQAIETTEHKETKRTLKKLFTDEIAKENYDSYVRGNADWQSLCNSFFTEYKKDFDASGDRSIERKYACENAASIKVELEKTKTQLTQIVWKIQEKMAKG